MLAIRRTLKVRNRKRKRHRMESALRADRAQSVGLAGDKARQNEVRQPTGQDDVTPDQSGPPPGISWRGLPYSRPYPAGWFQQPVARLCGRKGATRMNAQIVGDSSYSTAPFITPSTFGYSHLGTDVSAGSRPGPIVRRRGEEAQAGETLEPAHRPDADLRPTARTTCNRRLRPARQHPRTPPRPATAPTTTRATRPRRRERGHPPATDPRRPHQRISTRRLSPGPSSAEYQNAAGHSEDRTLPLLGDPYWAVPKGSRRGVIRVRPPLR
jgi:hypothetical protein